MATVNLDPNATVSNNWSLLGGGGGATAHGNLSDGTGTGITTSSAGASCIVALGDYSSGTPINSIRHYIKGFKYNTRSGDYEVRVNILNASLTILYSEFHQLLFNGYVAKDFYGTARTTSDGSSAWTDGDLDGLLLKIEAYENPATAGGHPLIEESYIEVNYGAVADNAIFFGTNF